MLTQIPAPPFKEEVRARKYAELLRAAGADSIHIDEVGNAIALRRGGGAADAPTRWTSTGSTATPTSPSSDFSWC